MQAARVDPACTRVVEREMGRRFAGDAWRQRTTAKRRSFAAFHDRHPCVFVRLIATGQRGDANTADREQRDERRHEQPLALIGHHEAVTAEIEQSMCRRGPSTA